MRYLLPCLFLISISFYAEVESSKHKGNVLFVAPVSSKSHKNFYYGIVNALAADGFKITILTPYAPAKVTPNVREIVYPENDIDNFIPNIFKEGNIAPMSKITMEGPHICFDTLVQHKTKEILSERYDLVYVSMFFGDCFLGYLHEKQIPFILVNPGEMFGPFCGSRIGNPSFSSFDFNPLLSYKPPLSFFQRTATAFLETFLTIFVNYNLHSVTSIGKSRGLFPGSMPSINEISNNVSLMVANSFRLAEHPRPYMPNILLAGGIHCKPPKPLPKDLEAWVQSSGEAGIIYFSLGSAVKASEMPKDTVKIILSVFKSLPQKILWKFNLDAVEGGVPDNVRLTKWAPQQDLLGHPKTRLFITHGGIFSTQEAQYHGVQILGLPIFGDQIGNMKQAEVNGWGLSLDWSKISEETFKDAIQQLVNDKEKRETSRKFGELMKDRPTDPADDVVFWANYIIRTGGAKHLRSGALNLSWYQLYNIDVWLFIFSCLVAVLWIMKKIVVFVFNMCCASKPKQKKFKKK